jgi:hypothetical protein
MNQRRKKQKQDNRRKTRRITPLRIAGWLVLAAFVGLAVFLAVDLVRTGRGSARQPTTAPVATLAAVATAGPYAGGARLYLPVTEIDLGNVPLMTPASYSFDLENVGDAPLMISNTSVKMLEGC